MDEVLKHSFSIKKVQKASDEDYLKALTIYNTTTPNDIRTKSNEISRWIGRNETTQSFDLLVFNLYMDDEIIGLAMLSYIRKTRIVVYDYIAVVDHFRMNAALFSYINLIQNYLVSKRYDITYFVVEISNKNNGKSIDKESLLFKKLVCLEGFGRIKATYQTAPLGLEHNESSFNAYLYIKANDILENISKETFMSIVHSIYYEYYLSWYSPILTPEETKDFKEIIDRHFSLQASQVSEKIDFDIEYIDCPLLGNLRTDKSFGYLPNKQKKTYGKYPALILLILLGPLLIIWGYNYVLNILEIPISTVNSIIGGAFTAILSSVTALLIAGKKKL